MFFNFVRKGDQVHGAKKDVSQKVRIGKTDLVQKRGGLENKKGKAGGADCPKADVGGGPVCTQYLYFLFDVV